MAELHITYCNLKHTPDTPRSGGVDGYRWHVGLREDGEDTYLVVDLSASAAIETQLSRTELTEQVPAALQRYADSKLTNDESVLGQVGMWNAPIMLRPEDFT